MTSLPPDARTHREQFKTYVIFRAEEWHRDHLGHLYRCWEGWNRDYFEGKLLPPYLLLLEPRASKAWGDFCDISGFGGRTQIRVRPSLVTGKHPDLRPGPEYAEGRRRFVEDVALHETVHQFANEVLEKPEASYKGHGPTFAGECNRIGAALGLPPVRPAKARGKQAKLPSCAQWPHNVRPDGYYLGALREEQDDPDEEKPKKKSLGDLLAALVSAALKVAPEIEAEFNAWMEDPDHSLLDQLAAHFAKVRPNERTPLPVAANGSLAAYLESIFAQDQPADDIVLGKDAEGWPICGLLNTSAHLGVDRYRYRVLVAVAHIPDASPLAETTPALSPLAETASRMVEPSSPVTAFVQDRCELGAGRSVAKGTLFEEWRMWCAESGHEPGTLATFGRNLHAAFPAIRHSRPGAGGESCDELCRHRPAAARCCREVKRLPAASAASRRCGLVKRRKR
jgi:hypothetical protein